MYTHFSLYLLQKLFNIASLLGYSPIVWSNKSQKFQVSISAYTLTFFSTLSLISYLFLLIPYNIMLCYQAKDYQQVIYTIVVFICALLGGLLLVGVNFFPEEICEALNGLLLFLGKFKSNPKVI